jgi:hypothetical protein
MNKRLHPRHPLATLALALILFACSAAAATAQNTQPDNNPADTVHGVVVNSVTHEPIARALVLSPDNRFATMTDGEGQFEFNFAHPEAEESKQDESTSGDQVFFRRPNRPDQLTARKPGFLSDENSTQSLQSATAGKEFTIALTPEALVVGRVALPSSEASDTIQLEIYRRQVRDGRAHWVHVSSTSTKSSGEFRFAELSAGTYKLLTRELPDRDPLTFASGGQLYGYPPVYFPNAASFAAAQTIQLTAGQVFQANISLVRHPYYPVKVAVVHAPTGVGIGVVVSAQGRGPGFALGYNYQDQMIEGSLPEGTYTLEASSFGPNAASGLLNISVKGAALEGPRIIMVPNGSIEVNVKEEFTSTEDSSQQDVRIIHGSIGFKEQGPRRYLNVYLEPADDFGQERGASLRPPTGPEDDSLALDGVQPGRYRVRTNSSRGFVASINSGTADLQHQLLVVDLGGTSSPIEITVRDSGAEIDGTIEGLPAPSENEPVFNPVAGNGFARMPEGPSTTHVYCVPLPDSSGEFRDVWVGPDGKFGPQELPPGTYHLLAFDHPQPELEYHNPEAMRAYEAKGQVVRLVAGQKEHLHLQLISSNE